MLNNNNDNEKNERYLLMNIFNNLNDVYLCMTEYDNCIYDKLCSVDNYKLMMSIINFSGAINTELNRIDRIDKSKKRKLEYI